MNHMPPGSWSPVFETEFSSSFVRPLAAPMRPPLAPQSTAVSPARRSAAFVAALAVQLVFVVLWFESRHIAAPARPPSLIVVDIAPPAIPEKPMVTPPAPVLTAPQVALALPTVPQIAVPAVAAAAPSETAITATLQAAPPPAASAESYESLLMRHLNAHKRYPAAARVRHQEGVVTIRFTMDRRGRVLARAIEKSSRVAALDEESLLLLDRAQPMPALPPNLKGAEIELVVPIAFTLH